MGLFDAIAKLQEMADNPDLEKTAVKIGEAAQAIPQLMASIDATLKGLKAGQSLQILSGDRIEQLLQRGNATLVEISAGLDAIADPVKRPPFGVGDVEAAMMGQWPVGVSIIHDLKEDKANGE